jgi:CHASE3 domain sensor protein
MNLNSEEDSEIVRLGFGLALVTLCLAIGFQYVLDRALTRVRESMNCAFEVLTDADVILDGLDRLSLDQRAFIRTGDLRFSQDLAESVMVIQSHMDFLRQVGRKASRLRDPVARLDRAVDWALVSLRKSNEVEKSEGPAAAIASLNNDESIDEARNEAQQLRKLVTDGAFERVRTERKLESILDVLI